MARHLAPCHVIGIGQMGWQLDFIDVPLTLGLESRRTDLKIDKTGPFFTVFNKTHPV
jgi:hypothetical protein